MRIIPAIDILNGKCVRLTKGDYNSPKIYRDDPLDVALEFEDHGIQFLHLVDLDGARMRFPQNLSVLNRIASRTRLKIDFSGGLKNKADLISAFDSGAEQGVLGSMAVKRPDLFIECLSQFGSDKIILGADCRDRKIATDGWLHTTDVDVSDFIAHYRLVGIQSVLCTDISKDGMLEGASEDLYREILLSNQVNLIASGGIRTISDLCRLTELGCEGAIVGKAIYEGFISLKELSNLC
jgi:phosphoribosylformimino-5-aminoimidazole carboxamide ribotide isomerase